MVQHIQAEPLQALSAELQTDSRGQQSHYRLSQCRAADRQQGAAVPLQALSAELQTDSRGQQSHYRLSVQSCRQTAGGNRATTGSHSAELQTDSRGQQCHYRLSVQSCRQTAGGSRATTGSQCRAADRQQGAAVPLQALSAELQTHNRGRCGAADKYHTSGSGFHIKKPN
ncbi:hypothetical protein CgunFtcFv8_012244 [Champsocephalus gunnari]|uniref:Uncharacterized protein n=1 Tax=Champsocephalus gunnari TaxID=52237 RepID=A0AAN8HIV1_CHAGU|nr:hypothetical protein CgunFtcFv8_012244 [Champsocephalus gunnari]